MFPLLPLAIALGEFAPLLGRILKGENSEEIAVKVVDVAKKVSGFQEEAEIIEVFRKDPRLATELQTRLIQLEMDLETQVYKDRHNARERDAEFIKGGRINHRADIMVIAAAAGLIWCLITLALYRGDLPGEAVGIISTIAGIFGACLKDAYAFEFGSSRGSKEKDDWVTAALLKK